MVNRFASVVLGLTLAAWVSRTSLARGESMMGPTRNAMSTAVARFTAELPPAVR